MEQQPWTVTRGGVHGTWAAAWATSSITGRDRMVWEAARCAKTYCARIQTPSSWSFAAMSSADVAGLTSLSMD